VSYLTSDSLTDLASDINAIAGVSAQVVSSGGNFYLEVTHDTNDSLTFTDANGGNAAAQLSITDNGSSVFSANVDGAAGGAADGTATVSGNSITVTSPSNAEGLKVFYSGNSDVNAVQIDFTVGIGTQLFFALDQLLDTTTGVVETDISALEDQNEVAEDRIDSMLDRLAIQRQSLTDRFIALEVALARAESIRETIEQISDALFASRR
jgi:hypothetical protein